MSIGIFLDKAHQPTAREIAQVLGARKLLWERLTRFIMGTYQMPGELTFGGKKYGWNFWYRKGGKALVSLYPQQGYFVAQVVLGGEQAEQALALKLGKKVRTYLEQAPQLHDGRWLFVKVRTEKDVKDIEQLLLIKKRPPRQKT